MKLIAFVGHAEAQAPHAMHFSLSMSKALSCSAIAPEGHASAQREHEAFLFRIFTQCAGSTWSALLSSLSMISTMSITEGMATYLHFPESSAPCAQVLRACSR